MAIVEAEQAAAHAEVKAEADRIAADPKTPFISRFRAGDFEKWEKLSLDQLQTIAQWLDA
jgi:hypothetical protein